jgi:hypothetical protein
LMKQRETRRCGAVPESGLSCVPSDNSPIVSRGFGTARPTSITAEQGTKAAHG